MQNIRDMLQQQPPMMQPQFVQQQPEPTEKAQLHIGYLSSPPLIMRYAKVRDAWKAHDKLMKAWTDYKRAKIKGTQPLGLYQMNGDMFDTTFDLEHVIALTFIDYAKKDKFIPR